MLIDKVSGDEFTGSKFEWAVISQQHERGRPDSLSLAEVEEHAIERGHAADLGSLGAVVAAHPRHAVLVRDDTGGDGDRATWWRVVESE